MKILIKFPTRGRFSKAVDVLTKYVTMADNMDNIKIVVSVDDDDTTVDINAFKSIHDNIDVFVGKRCTKIEAINRNIPDPSTFDILLLTSDDMIPVVNGYDKIIRDSMEQFYPDTDGVLFFNDGFTSNKLNTLVICGSEYYKRFDYIYYPEYKSFYCDNEFTDEAYRLNRQTYMDYTIIKHEHPYNIGLQYDELYTYNEQFMNVDHQLYYSRWKPSLDISIMICTIPTRNHFLETLLNDIYVHLSKTKLKYQILLNTKTDVSIGTKRNELLTNARGKYSAFIDDDDKITSSYFSVVEDAIKSGEDYDSIALNGRYYVNNVYIGNFYHSIQYPNWVDNVDSFYRPPNHVNPIKTSIARRIKFPDISHCEDRIYSHNIKDMIKTEYKHDLIQYLYYKRK